MSVRYALFAHYQGDDFGVEYLSDQKVLAISREKTIVTMPTEEFDVGFYLLNESGVPKYLKDLSKELKSGSEKDFRKRNLVVYRIFKYWAKGYKNRICGFTGVDTIGKEKDFRVYVVRVGTKNCPMAIGRFHNAKGFSSTSLLQEGLII